MSDDSGRKPGGPAGDTKKVATPPARASGLPLAPLKSSAAGSPFGEGDEDWESELAAWDAAIPMVNRSATSAPDVPLGDAAARAYEAAKHERAGDEDPFSDTPTTVVSPAEHLDLDDLPDMVSAATFDDGVAPASGSYAALVATDQSAPGLFEREPAPEAPPTFPAETPREMTAAAWSGDIAELVAGGGGGTCAAPRAEYWQTLAGVIAEERALAGGDQRRSLALALAASRVADLAGKLDEATAQARAALAVDGQSPAAHRSVLGLAERTGRLDVEEVAESLARLALTTHADQPYYRSLHAEWTLARAARGVADGSAAAAMTALPPGLGRILAEAELAWSEAPVAAALVESAAHRVGGALGAAFLSLAAGLHEKAGDYQAASEQRFVAARLDESRPLTSLAVLRDLARAQPEVAIPALEELVARVPPSTLRVAIARWGALLARRVGDRARAAKFLCRVWPGDGGTAVADDETAATAGLARDLFDLWPEAVASRAGQSRGGSTPESAPPLPAMGDLAGRWFARSLVPLLIALRQGELARTADEQAAALFAAEEAVARAGGEGNSSLLAPLIEELANRAAVPAMRRRALHLWRAIDPARWTSASYALADALVPTEAPDVDDQRGVLTTESILSEIAARDEASPVFWALAALAARRGRFAEAAAHIDQGLERPPWRDGPLAAPLSELAAELTARADLAAAVTRLNAGRVKPGLADMPRRTLGRLLRLYRDRDLWADYVEHEIATERGELSSDADRARRVTLLIEPLFWPSDSGQGDDVLSLVAAALEASPMHPVAFALSLLGQPEPAALVDGFIAGASDPGGALWRLGAAVAAAAAGDLGRALTLAEGRDVADDGQLPGEDQLNDQLRRSIRATLRRLAWAVPVSERRVRLLRALDVDSGPFSWSIDGEATQDHSRRDPTADLLDAVRASDWPNLVNALIDAPLHEDRPGADTFTVAALIDQGRCEGKRGPVLWSRARAALSAGPSDAPGVTPAATEALASWHTSDLSSAEAAVLAAALDQLAAIAADGADERSAALLLVTAAWLEQGQEQEQDKRTDVGHEGRALVERRLRAAVAHDSTSVPAAVSLRRWLAAAGRRADAARAFGAEAEAWIDPARRVQALLRGAALLVPAAHSPSRAPEAAAAAAARAERITEGAALLHRALQISPSNHEAFTRLRDLYEEAGRHADLAQLLAARMRVTSNPFEVTALHLTRAELFAGPLADPAAARMELEAILLKEPQHARALTRLAELEAESGNHAAAADLLIRRAFTERSPEKLRDLFLRLGRIYTHHLPDAKRAVGAYARVLQLDTNNREALDELSRLYLGLGETKSAISITERLVQLESAPEARSRYHMRLGQLAERASDPRGAGLHFRRAAEDAPRDIEALGELMRHLEKTRDSAGRRAYLDRAAADLRATVLARPDDRSALEALVAVLRWRGRGASAAAAAELVVLMDSLPDGATTGRRERAAPPSLPAWAAPPPSGRSLAALTRGSVDEQTFPAAVLPSVRQLFRLLGPVLWEGRAELTRYGVERADRVPAGRAPRDHFDAMAAELTTGNFELYVAPARDSFGVVSLAVEPGKPPAIILGAGLLKMGPAALRFAAARALRLIATHLHVALAGKDADLGLWLGSVVRQFVPDYRVADVPADQLAEPTARVAKLMPRRLRQEIMPFAMESSGQLDLRALRAGIRDGVNRVGLLACGSLTAAVRVLLATAPGAGTAPNVAASAAALLGNAEIQALLAFALSDEYDELVKAIE